MSAADFTDVTELPGDAASDEELRRLYTRYYWAGDLVRGGDVLEVGCGAGQGLGYLASLARTVVGGDVSATILNIARKHYGERIPLEQFDAEHIPFADGSFDALIIFEAIYYLKDAAPFLREAHRVLRPGGRLLITTANKDLFDFTPSPHSVAYLGVADLAEMLDAFGFSASFYGDTPTDSVSSWQRLLRPLKLAATAFGIMPKSKRMKALLKRVVFGETHPFPAEVAGGMPSELPLDRIPSDRPDTRHKVVFVEAVRQPVRLESEEATDEHHMVSVLIPCYQEEKFIVSCVESVRNFTLPPGWSLEILVVDGGSTDATKALVQQQMARDDRVRLLHNPRRTQSTGMNLGIASCEGDYILRIDAHSIYPKDYLAKCVQTSRRTSSDNVGGMVRTQARGEGYEPAVVQALTTHWFGVGTSFRTGAKEGSADTVPYGFFRRDVFERFGLFDERLLRGQDYEFNRRIGSLGGLVWLNPRIVLQYFQQPNLKSFLSKQFFSDAPYNAYMWYLAPYTFTPRHAVSALFVLGLIVGIPLSFINEVVALIVGSVVALYAALAIAASFQQAIRYRRPLHIFILPFCFAAYHITHGLGVLIGLVKIVFGAAPVRRTEPAWVVPEASKSAHPEAVLT